MRPIVSLTCMILCVLSLTSCVGMMRGEGGSPAFPFLQSSQTELVVEDFVGRKYSEELFAELFDAGYNVTVSYRHSSEEEGTIISQSKEPGQSATVTMGNSATYIPLTLYVSRGPDEIILKDYAGMGKDEAIADLRSLGLTADEFNVTESHSDEVESGCVISTDPPAGTAVNKGDRVTVTVSSPEDK